MINRLLLIAAPIAALVAGLLLLPSFLGVSLTIFGAYFSYSLLRVKK